MIACPYELRTASEKALHEQLITNPEVLQDIGAHLLPLPDYANDLAFMGVAGIMFEDKACLVQVARNDEGQLTGAMLWQLSAVGLMAIVPVGSWHK